MSTPKAEKKRWPIEEARAVAEALADVLGPFCDVLIVAGSIRRRKPDVGDVEIVYVSQTEPAPPGDFFAAPGTRPLIDTKLAELLADGTLEKRLKVTGSATWGEANKLAVHKPTGIPVDLFATTHEAFANYLVCRTGGARTNMQIATKARAIGWKWNNTGEGFTRIKPPGRGDVHRVTSEREVFDFVGLPYREPWERE